MRRSVRVTRPQSGRWISVSRCQTSQHDGVLMRQQEDASGPARPKEHWKRGCARRGGRRVCGHCEMGLATLDGIGSAGAAAGTPRRRARALRTGRIEPHHPRADRAQGGTPAKMVTKRSSARWEGESGPRPRPAQPSLEGGSVDGIDRRTRGAARRAQRKNCPLRPKGQRAHERSLTASGSPEFGSADWRRGSAAATDR